MTRRRKRVPLPPAAAFSLGAIAMTVPAAAVVAFQMPWRWGLAALACAVLILTLIPNAYHRED